MLRATGATVIHAARIFFERGGPNPELRLRRLARTPTITPDVGICYVCHRTVALNRRRECLRCANLPSK